jgi:F-type H+-transporting ATPase subunit delta
MAELATIARPYAEALFKAGANADVAAQVKALAAVASDGALRHFADNPTVSSEQVFNVMSDVVGRKGITLSAHTQNFLREVLDNGRISALPEIAHQVQNLLNTKNGVSDAVIQSAFPMDQAQLDALVATLQTRFGRKLNAKVEVQPELIGGVRVVVGDEVLDTSVRARLETMKAALTA